MSIPFKARLVDLTNLFIAKVSNFLLTVLLFALLSRGMDRHAFGEFGYWWGIAIMIGGLLLGGLSSALVRTAVAHGSLRHLLLPMRRAWPVLFSVVLILMLGIVSLSNYTMPVLLYLALTLFGLAVQAQTVVLALLRAVEATLANAVASLLIMLLVPLSLHVMLGAERALHWVFLSLACVFSIGTIAGLVSARGHFGHLLSSNPAFPVGRGEFLKNVSSFTAVNIFSYAIVNGDFTIFRVIGTPEDFALMATCKIFFERFVVPALMVFAGAISLLVLRYPQGGVGKTVQLEVKLSPQLLVAMVLVVALFAFAYWVFAHMIRGDETTIPLLWVASAATGYFLYAVNGILFDLLVTTRPLRIVVVHVAAFVVLGITLQSVAIRIFGVPGWALGWLLFNLIVVVTLAHGGLHLRFIGWGNMAGNNKVVENR